jgi:hypothetical protein
MTQVVLRRFAVPSRYKASFLTRNVKWMQVHNLLCSGIADDTRCGSEHINGSCGCMRSEPLGGFDRELRVVCHAGSGWMRLQR